MFLMKTWKKFIFIPLIIWLFLSMAASLFDLLPIQYSALKTILLILVSLSIVAFPYSMLRTAPKHSYTATLCYMSLFCVFILLIRIYLWTKPLDYSFIYMCLFWTVCAFLIHFFFTDEKFKLKKS